ncbi:polysaccharide deacetylase [Clostridium sp. DSM 100503]|uniref:polysaccharide deacetylase family protein n=1 Tax=Clostridium sp. DSM 100503 TaxID=2963282 RepID=UPI00214A6B34|nr:polysaccharide deacetylase family protein [Clostridium sp. DSM 100503]MCR1951292.1 polysaccharide deacetylase [Clostridium sp. DSM 100503]
MIKIILRIVLILLILIGGSGIISRFNSNNGRDSVNAEVKRNIEQSGMENDKNLDKTQSDKDETLEIEDLKRDNSGYLSLEEDINAEDAVVVSENINALVTGRKRYPVRTDGKKVVYLTFDDGPSITNTPEVLKVLDEYNVKGTFCILGKSIAKNDDSKKILKDIVKNGHAVANHTYSHDYNNLYPNGVINVENFIKDIEKNNELMRSILGKDFFTRVIRFPGGYWSWDGREEIKEVLLDKGYVDIFWNALNKDAEGCMKNAEQLLSEVKNTVEALGAEADSIVLLMHDTYGKEETVKSLPLVIEYFKHNGFEFKTLK